jgi:hypothetical protein
MSIAAYLSVRREADFKQTLDHAMAARRRGDRRNEAPSPIGLRPEPYKKRAEYDAVLRQHCGMQEGDKSSG